MSGLKGWFWHGLDIFCSSPDKISKSILMKSGNDIYLGIIKSTESISGDRREVLMSFKALVKSHWGTVKTSN